MVVVIWLVMMLLRFLIVKNIKLQWLILGYSILIITALMLLVVALSVVVATSVLLVVAPAAVVVAAILLIAAFTVVFIVFVMMIVPMRSCPFPDFIDAMTSTVFKRSGRVNLLQFKNGDVFCRAYVMPVGIQSDFVCD